MTTNRYGPTTPTGRHRTARRLTPPNPLWGSNGIAFGPDGRLHVAQFLAGRISAVDLTTGDVEVIVPETGPVQSPDDLAFGADGTMYITDLIPGRVWQRDRSGGFTLLSDGVTVPNGITCVGDRLFVNEMKPRGRLVELLRSDPDPVVLADELAMGNAMQQGPDGHLYYPHMLTGKVFRVPISGGTPELVAENVHAPVAVRFDLNGTLFVLSRGVEGFVTRIDLFGTGDTTVIPTGVVGLDNAAFDTENRMYVSSFAAGGITEVSADGRTTPVVPQGLTGPFGVTIDLRGTVYAGDHYRVTDPTGSTTHALLPFVHGVAADGDQVHLTSQYGDVRTYDAATGEVRERLSGLDQPMGIAVRADGTLVVAESGAGRVLAIADEVAVLAEGLGHPVDVALDADLRCYVSDDRQGTVSRLDDGEVVVVVEGLDAPQGLAVHGDDLFVVETGRRRVIAVSLTTGERRVEAEDLAVGLPPGVTRVQPDLFVGRIPGAPRQFAGVAVGADGALYVSANGEGSVVRLSPGG